MGFYTKDGGLIGTGQKNSFTGVGDLHLKFLNSSSTLDVGTGFSLTSGTAIVNTIVVQPDGKLLVGGNFDTYKGTTQNRIVRLLPNGSVDTTFNPGGSGFDSVVSDIVLQPDGKILVGGNFNGYNGVQQIRFLRLNSDGTLDTSFNTGGIGPTGQVQTIFLHSTGKIWIGGDFQFYNGVSANRIAGLNSDGTRDTTTFNFGGGANGTVFKITSTSSSQFIVVGSFTQFNSITRNYNVRLNYDGSAVTSYTYNSSIVNSLTISSTEIYFTGNFIAGNARGLSRRIGATLVEDTTFNSNIGTGSDGGTVSGVHIQPDNKILVYGYFGAFNGITHGRLFRLNSDGTLDTNFNIGTGFNNAVATLVLKPGTTKTFYVGGQFTSFNGTSYNRLAELTFL
jgi:uncharacterized delta-60 repeat protein